MRIPAMVVTANDIPRLHGKPHRNSLSMQAEGRNATPTSAEPAAVPVAAQLQGAHGVNISGNTRFMNIGMNTGNLTTVYNYGGIHGVSFSVLHRFFDLTGLQGLEKLERFVSFAALHDSAEQDPDRRCHPGTRNTVLRQLRDWFDNQGDFVRILRKLYTTIHSHQIHQRRGL
ncbi:hypothetical protein JOM56_004834 [Amanita muscaria]